MNNKLIKTIAVAITTLSSFSIYANSTLNNEDYLYAYGCSYGSGIIPFVLTNDWGEVMQAQYDCEQNGGRFRLFS